MTGISVGVKKATCSRLAWRSLTGLILSVHLKLARKRLKSKKNIRRLTGDLSFQINGIMYNPTTNLESERLLPGGRARLLTIRKLEIGMET